MLSGVADDGDEDDANELGGQVPLLCCSRKAVDENVRQERKQDADDSESDEGKSHAVGWPILFFIVVGFQLFGVEKCLVGVELENDVTNVDHTCDSGDLAGDLEELRISLLEGVQSSEAGRDNEGHDGQEKQRCVGVGGICVEGHVLEFQTPDEESATEDEEHVTEDGTDQGQFDQLEHSSTQRHDRDDQLCSVTEGNVDQGTDDIVRAESDILGEVAEQGSQGHETEERGEEEDTICESHLFTSECHRDEH